MPTSVFSLFIDRGFFPKLVLLATRDASSGPGILHAGLIRVSFIDRLDDSDESFLFPLGSEVLIHSIGAALLDQVLVEEHLGDEPHVEVLVVSEESTVHLVKEQTYAPARHESESNYR